MNASSTDRATKQIGLVPVRCRPWTSAEWLAWFRLNAARKSLIPWEAGPEITDDELAIVSRSLQAWQLGESSDGRHLRHVAGLYATRIGDPDYAVVIDMFIAEEQGHGELLGRFLDLAGPGRVQADWGDSLFRFARYCLPNMESWTMPVVMVETLAMIYYNAVRRATRSRILSSICIRLLADEGPHIRLQCERLAVLRRGRSKAALLVTHGLQHLFFLIVVMLVWVGHRQVLRAGGYSWCHYWRASWDRMKAAWERMNPGRYDWTQKRNEHSEEHPASKAIDPPEQPRTKAGRERAFLYTDA